MTEWVLAAHLSELVRRKKTKVVIDGHDIALFHIGGEVYALQDACVHKQRWLSRGTVLRGRVVCPGHQWEFDPGTGAVEDREECQPTFPVRVDGEHVYVDLAPAAQVVR